MNELFRAVGGIDDTLIEAAEAPPGKQKRIYWIPVAVSAAAAAAIAGLFVMNARRTPKLPLTPQSTQPTATVTVTETDPVPTDTTAPTTQLTTKPTTQPTTKPTTQPTTVPTTVPTTPPATIPPTAPTTVPTTQPTTKPTTQPTTVPTTQPTSAPTTQPTTVPTTAPTTVAPTTVPSIEPSVQPVTDPEPETEPPTRVQPEGEEWVIIGGKRCFPLRDAALSDYNVAAYLGRVSPQPFKEAFAEEEASGSAPLGEAGEDPAQSAPLNVPFSPFAALSGAKVYQLVPFPGTSVSRGAPHRYYLLETETQSMIYAY